MLGHGVIHTGSVDQVDFTVRPIFVAISPFGSNLSLFFCGAIRIKRLAAAVHTMTYRDRARLLCAPQQQTATYRLQ